VSTAWDPGQYLKFRDERTRPSIDLAARLDLASPVSILDVGCGPGNSTEVLHDRWPAARITGLDPLQPAAIQIGAPLTVDFVEVGEGEARKTYLAFKAL